MISIFVNSGTSLSGSTDDDIVDIPNISTVKPSSIFAVFFFLFDFDIIIMKTPIIASIGVKFSGLQRFINRLSPFIPERLSIHAVTVVPIFAPIVIPIAWESFMMPEFTKPTTMTVVADDDWIIPVTTKPSNTPFIGLEVSLSSIRSSLPPPSFSSPLPMISIP